MTSVPDLRTNILLRSEQSGGHLSMVEIVVPARSAGPPLHTHDFDEAFYMLEGELIFQVEDALITKRGRAVVRPTQCRARARQPQRCGRALSARVHAGRVRAALGADRRRLAGRRATGLGAAADPRRDRGRPADRVGWITARPAVFIASFEPGVAAEFDVCADERG